MTGITKGNKVKVEYTGKFENGQVFDSSESHGQPLEFEVGSGQMIKGFDTAVLGMEEGEEKEITLKPEAAYGQPNLKFMKKVSRDQLPQDHEPQVGMILSVSLPNGQKFPAKIVEVTNDNVTIDFNHPLAGKTLIFRIKVVGIN